MPRSHTEEWIFNQLILRFDTREESGKLPTAAALFPGKYPVVPTGQEVGWVTEPDQDSIEKGKISYTCRKPEHCSPITRRKAYINSKRWQYCWWFQLRQPRLTETDKFPASTVVRNWFFPCWTCETNALRRTSICN
jgi:hypothetical protein